jgi:hypothetical protein
MNGYVHILIFILPKYSALPIAAFIRVKRAISTARNSMGRIAQDRIAKSVEIIREPPFSVIHKQIVLSGP